MSGEPKLCCNCKHYWQWGSEASDQCVALVGRSLVRGSLTGREYCTVMRLRGQACGPDGVLFVENAHADLPAVAGKVRRVVWHPNQEG